MDKSHIEHAIGFVEDQQFNVVQTQSPLTHQIEQAPGRSHENIGPLSQRGDLAIHRYSSENNDGPEGQMSSIRVQAGLNLQCQLSSGSEHEGTQALSLASQKPVEHRQAKRGGLPGSGLRGCHQILACQYFGDGCTLNICRLTITFLAYGSENGFA